MEALGRMIAVTLSAVGMVFLLLFYRTASVRWQKEETIRSMCQTFAEDILEQKEISVREWDEFKERMNRLGEYRTELAVYERRVFERDDGRVFLYVRREEEEHGIKIPEGSYIRLVVTEEPEGALKRFLFGDGCVFFSGGRVT